MDHVTVGSPVAKQDALTVATNRTSGSRTKDGQQFFEVEIDSPVRGDTPPYHK